MNIIEKAVVLVSGGMDSCVTAALAARTCCLYFLHLNYGQRTQKREERAFRALCEHFSPKKVMVVDISHLEKIGGSALTDRSIDLPRNTDARGDIPVTYVPFRNAHLLSIAVSWAEVAAAKKIFIGAVEEDSSGYPDCRESFYRAFQKTIDTGTKPGSGIVIETPLIHHTKKEIVETGVGLNVPFHLTWSCYGEEEKACGTCDSCRLRLKGFREAGVDDPIPYILQETR